MQTMSEKMELALSERDRRLCGKLYVSGRDIVFAQQCAELILKKGWHYKPWEKRGSVYFQQSVYVTALVVSYARAFTKSKSWPRLTKEPLGYSLAEKGLHKNLIELRNKVYAHSDSEKYSIRTWRSGSFSTDIVSEPFMMISPDEAKRFLRMTKKALSAIESQRNDLL